MADLFWRMTEAWEFNELVIRPSGSELEVRLTGTEREVDGKARPDLHPAREVDISVSPLSNTLPIRRLGLAVGESDFRRTITVDEDGLVIECPGFFLRGDRWGASDRCSQKTTMQKSCGNPVGEGLILVDFMAEARLVPSC